MRNLRRVGDGVLDGVVPLLDVVAAGESAELAFALTLHDFTLTAPEGGRHAAPGTWTIVVGDAKLETEIVVR